MKRIVLAITGASGVCYAKRLYDYLRPRAELHIVVSDRGAELLKFELGITPAAFSGENVTVYKNSRINAPIASGSYRTMGMIVRRSSSPNTSTFGFAGRPALRSICQSEGLRLSTKSSVIPHRISGIIQEMFLVFRKRVRKSFRT